MHLAYDDSIVLYWDDKILEYWITYVYERAKVVSNIYVDQYLHLRQWLNSTGKNTAKDV